MIPKIIHYCWFGKKPLPELAVKCIESWKKYCPDYEIKEWNEDNFDINYCSYVSEAYEAKKWAFITDVVRLYALVNYGGVYMDVDVEIIKPIDDLLHYKAVSGFESETEIPTGLMASEKNHPLFRELLNEYNNIHFKLFDGKNDMTTNVERITNTCLKYGLNRNNQMQTIRDFTLLPKDFLCPKSYITGEINITENTYTIHHFNASWQSEEDKHCIRLETKLKKVFGKTLSEYIARFIVMCIYRGFFKTIVHSFKVAVYAIKNRGSKNGKNKTG